MKWIKHPMIKGLKYKKNILLINIRKYKLLINIKKFNKNVKKKKKKNILKNIFIIILSYLKDIYPKMFYWTKLILQMLSLQISKMPKQKKTCR